MEDAVKDMVLGDLPYDDPILEQLVRLTLLEVVRGHRLYQSPLDEPYFFQRHFKTWVEEGLVEYQKVKEIEEQNVRGIQETQPGA